MRHTFERLFEQADLSIQALAEKSGVPISKIEAILSGRWLPSPEERDKLVRALSVQAADVDWGHTMNPRNVRYHRFGFPDEPTEETR